MAYIVEHNEEKQYSNNSKDDTENSILNGNIKWNGHGMDDKSLKGSIPGNKVACLGITQESCMKSYPNAILNKCSPLHGKNAVLPTEYQILQPSRQSDVQHLIIPSVQGSEVPNNIVLLSDDRTVELIIDHKLIYRVLEAFYHYMRKNAFNSRSLFRSLKATHLNSMFFGRKYLCSSELISQEMKIPPAFLVKSFGSQMCRDHRYLSRTVTTDEGGHSCNSVSTNKHDILYDSGPNLFLLMFLRSLEILSNLYKISSQLQVLIEEGMRNNQTLMKIGKANGYSQTSSELSCAAHVVQSSDNTSASSVSIHSLNDKNSNWKCMPSSSSSSSGQSSTDNKVAAPFGTKTPSVSVAIACQTHDVKDNIQSETTYAINKGSSPTNFSFHYRADSETPLLIKKGSQHGTDKPFSAFINTRNNSELISELPAASDTVSGQSTTDIQSFKIPAVNFKFIKCSQILFNSVSTHSNADENSMRPSRDVPFWFGATTCNSTNKPDCISATDNSCRESTFAALSSSHLDKSPQFQSQVGDIAGSDGSVKRMALSNIQPFQTNVSTYDQRPPTLFSAVGAGIFSKMNSFNTVASKQSSTGNIVQPVISPACSDGESIFGAWHKTANRCNNTAKAMTTSTSLSMTNPVITSGNSATSNMTESSSVFGKMVTNITTSSSSNNNISSVMFNAGESVSNSNKAAAFIEINNSEGFLPGATSTISSHVPASSLSGPAVSSSTTEGRIFDASSTFTERHKLNKSTSTNFLSGTTETSSLLFTFPSPATTLNSAIYTSSGNVRTCPGQKSPELLNDATGVTTTGPKLVLRPPTLVLDTTTNNISKRSAESFSIFKNSHIASKSPSLTSGVMGTVNSNQNPLLQLINATNSSVPLSETSKLSNCGMTCNMNQVTSSLSGAKRISTTEPSSSFASTVWTNSVSPKRTTASSVCEGKNYTRGVASTVSPLLRPAKLVLHDSNSNVTHSTTWASSHFGETVKASSTSTGGPASFTIGISDRPSKFKSRNTTSCFPKAARKIASRRRKSGAKLDYGGCVFHNHDHKSPLKDSTSNKESRFVFGSSSVQLKCSKGVQTDSIQLANIDLSKIWSILECPVCLEIALPPVYQCDKGHHACNNCWRKLKSCPLCKSYRSMMSRNFVAEAIAEVVVLPCRFHVEGCKDAVLLVDKPRHEAVCFHRTHKCPVPGCKESHSFHNMSCHLSEKHGCTVKVKTQAVSECKKKFSEVMTVFSLTPLVHAYNILGWGLFFLCHSTTRSTSALWMQMIPTTREQTSFQYQVEVMDHLGCHGVSYRGTVALMDKTSDEVLQKDEFLTVPNLILKSLKQHHNLKITIHIWH